LDSETFSISDTYRYTLSTVYLACSLLAALFVAVFVDPLSLFSGSSAAAENKVLVLRKQ
jgi:hypothetical protein